MGLARYFVTCVADRWLVTLEGRLMARCANEADALSSAIVMADLMGAMSHDADVAVQRDEAKPLEIIWTYGRDPLPQSARRKRKVKPQPSHVRLVQRADGAAAS